MKQIPKYQFGSLFDFDKIKRRARELAERKQQEQAPNGRYTMRDFTGPVAYNPQ